MTAIDLASRRRILAAEKILNALGFVKGSRKWLSPLEIAVAEIFDLVAPGALAPLPEREAVDYDARLELQNAAQEFVTIRDSAPEKARDAALLLESLGVVFDGQVWTTPPRRSDPELEAVGDVLAWQLGVMMAESAAHVGPDDPFVDRLDRQLKAYADVRYSEAEREEQRRRDAGVVSYRDFLRYGLSGKPPNVE